MATASEYNERLAELYKAAEADGCIVNTYGEEGCPPCGTFADPNDTCVGCPYRLRDNGYNLEA